MRIMHDPDVQDRIGVKRSFRGMRGVRAQAKIRHGNWAQKKKERDDAAIPLCRADQLGAGQSW
ncbi:hypothetical protein CWO90_41535 [Bradyrhizobium sp. Leo121]|nr:hypothetical protein CWO90_41535 [Bradyrhizobium sp. Leo121]